ncbi:MAG: hypothetical protein OHK0024_26880 [Thalassobaculales bacterium]
MGHQQAEDAEPGILRQGGEGGDRGICLHMSRLMDINAGGKGANGRGAQAKTAGLAARRRVSEAC